MVGDIRSSWPLLPIGDTRSFEESIRKTLGYRSVKRCIKEINLLHPDFVIISGDLVFGQLYPFEYRREYKKCYEMIQKFDVPTYLAPGDAGRLLHIQKYVTALAAC